MPHMRGRKWSRGVRLLTKDRDATTVREPDRHRGPTMFDQPSPPLAKRRGLRKRIAVVVIGLLLAYLVVAYVAVPALWTSYARRHPSLEDLPGITYTADGIP